MFNLFVGMVLLWCLTTNEYNRYVYKEGSLSMSIVLGIICLMNLIAALAQMN